MKTCFIISHIPDPRINRRIDLAKEYSEVFLIYLDRTNQSATIGEIYDFKNYPIKMDYPDSQQLINRYLKFNKYKNIALKIIKKIKPDIIYADMYDALAIAVEYKKKYKDVGLVYEVCDLRELFISKQTGIMKILAQKLLVNSEKMYLNYVDRLVITSEKFYEIYYSRFYNKKNVIFIPNAANFNTFKNYKKKQNGPFTVGYMGGIRYLNQLKLLIDAVRNSDIKVIFAGGSVNATNLDELKKYSEGMDNVIFTGPYNYEKEIANLYGLVDCIYSVYDASNENVRIALPNKLYDAIICQLPIIVAKNTYLAELVNGWGIGLDVGYINLEELKQALNRLSNDTDFYKQLTENCKKITKTIEKSNKNEDLIEYFSSFRKE